MNARITKLRARRVFRKRQRQVDDLTDSASKHIDKHIFKRLGNFVEVGRFMVAWLLLLIVLISGVVYQTRSLRSYYMSTQYTAGGVFSEGMVGTFTTPNPLFASSSVDLSVSKLLFNSLLVYDYNGDLVNDLASSVTKDDSGKTYTVQLRKDVLWHDGTPLTSADVAFTYATIQNPDTKSPYNLSWQGITIATPNADTVVFTLPSALNSFPLSLTNGIIPKHLLDKVPASQLRGDSFNASPVGSGPFKLTDVERIDDFNTNTKQQRLQFTKNEDYFKGHVQLDTIVLYALAKEEDVINAMSSRQIDATVYSEYPSSLLAKIPNAQVTSTPLLGGSYIFFNMSHSALSTVEIRKALIQGTNISKLLAKLPYPVREVDSPLLKSHVGYDASLSQEKYDLGAANAILDQQGWVRDGGGLRAKDGKQLEFTLTTLDGSDFAFIASELQRQWSEDLGVKLNIALKSSTDNQQAILHHSYDILLYGLSIGSDPDVYAYWHSSQAVSERFNLSEYKSSTVDLALESGRTRPDEALRAAKYKPLLDSWKKDVPAIGLYQPPVFFVTRSPINNFTPITLNSIADQYYGVENWQILTSKQPIIKQ